MASVASESSSTFMICVAVSDALPAASLTSASTWYAVASSRSFTSSEGTSTLHFPSASTSALYVLSLSVKVTLCPSSMPVVVPFTVKVSSDSAAFTTSSSEIVFIAIVPAVSSISFTLTVTLCVELVPSALVAVTSKV